MSDSLIPSFLVSDMSESLRLLTKNEQCEQIAQVANFLAKNEQFARKTDEQIPSPAASRE